MRQMIDLALPQNHGFAVIPNTAVRLALSDAIDTGAADIGAESRVIRYIFSDESVARDGHTIAADGWQLDNYKANPVFLWAHDGSQPPIGRTIQLIKSGTRLLGDVEYADRDTYPFADTIFRLVKGGYLNAVSVSWMPIEWKYSSDKSRPGGIDFKRQDLLEVSQAPVPSLPTALATARASGIDTGPLYDWAEKILDGGARVIIPRSELELLRKEARMPKLIRPRTAAPLVPPPVKPVRQVRKFDRGLYTVSCLADLLQWAAWIQQSTAEEAAWEGDNSPIPGQLADVLRDLGAILVAMTDEEVAELLADLTPAGVDAAAASDAGITDTDVLAHAAAVIANHRTRVLQRAGRVLSAENERCLRTAADHHEKGLTLIRGILDQVDNGDAEPTDPADPEDPASPENGDEDTASRALRARKARLAKAKAATL